MAMTLTQRRKVYRTKHRTLDHADPWARLIIRDGQLAIAGPIDTDYGPDQLEYPTTRKSEK
jgi:hypothetical protein